MSNHVHTELTIRSTDANRFIEALKLEQYHCHLNDGRHGYSFLHLEIPDRCELPHPQH